MQDGNTPQTIHRADYKPSAYLIDTVDLHFDLHETETHVSARMHVIRNPASVTDTSNKPPLVLFGEKMRLVSLHIDGVVLDDTRYQLTAETLTITDVPDDFILDIHSVNNPVENKSLEGLYVSGGNFCTQCEAEGFRNIIWFLDRPDVMAKYRTTLVADAKKYPVLLSNGNLVAEGKVGAGRHFATWEDPFRKPSYLFALVAGNLGSLVDHFTTMSGRTVELRVYTEFENLDKVQHCMDSIKKSMKWDEEAFGREYDLDIYMIVAVGDFNFGAMENKGLNIFNTKYVLAKQETATDADYQAIEGVVGHEYFHNWSGNRVTCRDWFQLSLKEGFTVFRDQEFSSDVGSRAVKRIEDVKRLRAAQFPEDEGPNSHPIRPDAYQTINNFYTATVYEKGAEVVRMQQTLLGKDAFRKGTDLYFARHDGQAVTCDDFVKAISDASGRDMTLFSRWYSQSGTPTVTVKSHYDAAAKTYTLHVAQSTKPSASQAEKLPLLIPLRTGLLGADGKDMAVSYNGHTAQEHLLELTDAEQTFVFAGVETRPVLSMLRDFSAPVRLVTDATEDDLLFRMSHDSDAFNRWEASQELAQKYLLGMIAEAQQGNTPVLPEKFVAAFGKLLDDGLASSAAQDGTQANQQPIDRSLIAYAMLLPSELTLAEFVEVVDVVAIHHARKAAVRTLASTYEDKLRSLYASLQDNGPFSVTPEAIGKRTLRNVCLSYVNTAEVISGVAKDGGTARRHLESATNMTDAAHALALIADGDSDYRATALAAFASKWTKEALVMDKWFSMQAASSRASVLDDVKALLQHPNFSLQNPNKVRSLVGVFCASNPLRFHDESGASYTFLADLVVEIDGFNPQLAARMVIPMTRYTRFDSKRQELMRAALQKIVDKAGLSKDTYEIASKALSR